MLFNSIQFLIFFPVVTILYFSIPHKYRWILLLVASYYFYMCWKIEYIVLIWISTLIDYFASVAMGKTEDRKKRRKYLLLSLFSNLGLLFVFKYFNFFSSSLNHVFRIGHIDYQIPYLSVLLPVGISFYTFQTLSYTIDVYKGIRKPEKHLGMFALYVAFFPQLVAGPIERSTHLLPQFFKKHNIDFKRITDGLKLMLWGMFKKIVIADRLAVFVDKIYNNPHNYEGLPLIIATVFFAFQIYCDFSGYSDIAIGSAKVLGFDLMDNFRRPYFSRSVTEFWRRWHISLSTWFRDYVYIPLGGNKVTLKRWHFNILTVFVVSGLWHGANWTFIIWGAMHGFIVIIEKWTWRIRERMRFAAKSIHLAKVYKWIEIIGTFIVVLFTWIFFRAKNVNDAIYILTHFYKNLGQDISHIGMILSKTNTTIYYMVVSLLVILFMEFVHFIQEHVGIRSLLYSKPLWFRWTIYYILIFSIIFFGEFGDQQFIYFQF